ncbi:ABC transporter substrate-binding protein [Actinomadura sp. PM05-2]|uniref:ABC transporter substrate-binding protein n=2 Tax=Actinomadura parmotrematis TaxID=2864039 RepID=A0ABS7G2V0_9ACTN|nr:ABC transporter substrate-binding protein [Actinomadura parmotrematis]
MAVAGAAALAGCAGPGGEGSRTGPVRDGGTLRIAGSSDVDHLDTASAGSTVAYGLTRTFARTLLGYQASNSFDETVPVQADMAARVPTRENGDVSKDGRTYTVRLRPGVRWNTAPPRPVVAQDFVRGFERLCNPASPSPGQGYFRSTLKGMDAYCKGFAGVDPRSAAAIARYQRDHSIEGVRADGDGKIVFELREPAADFPNLLALQYAAAAPREYDAYVPDSAEFRRHTVSDGPYQITDYRPGRSYTLGRNPVWRAADDPLRGRHADRIEITLGQDSAESVQRMLEGGSADLAWDQPVPTSALPRLRGDARFAVRDLPSANPYLVFNTRSPSNGGALGKPEVRRALEYAVDRSALVKIAGGPDVAAPLHTVIPPGNAGYAPANPYPVPGEGADPATCRARLAKAGYRSLTLRFPYRTNGLHRLFAQSIAADLKNCGVTAELTADTGGDFYGRTLGDPEQAAAGRWDIAAPGWTPDWYGGNGRSIIQPLFGSRAIGRGGTNYGGYSSPQVDALIDAALTAPDAGRAAWYWQQADRQIMRDAAIVPLLDRAVPLCTSARVRGARFLPTANGYDYTRIWLAR